MSYRPYVWQMVKEAMDNIGEKATYSEIKKYIHSKYDNVNDNTINCQIIVCTVNHRTRIHYPENKKSRIANTKYDYLYTIGRGEVEKYRPDKHGIWEIKEDETGKLIVALRENVNEKIENTNKNGIFEKKKRWSIHFHLKSILEILLYRT
ncbi:DUF7669 domain-containing protein [Tepidibacter hydrothermalis]|uniref:DUF7669 domain-containing protein n=1 Tax=Tepidibacter hydrothermalis TaxID=3036126 RepID=A0ABY8EG03_9FIRM|nr:hypothetical protein [Tepidibacter hydrothermalis]WFD09780.1 hypothetical protein P4S50_15485 [Tepidibacter hydrothermalis]